jgi:hypothetical protein
MYGIAHYWQHAPVAAKRANPVWYILFRVFCRNLVAIIHKKATIPSPFFIIRITNAPSFLHSETSSSTRRFPANHKEAWHSARHGTRVRRAAT